MLGNTDIRTLVGQEQLIDNFEEECLRNCSYRLRVGKLIKPGGADVLNFEGDEPMTEGKIKGWIRKIVDNAYSWVHSSEEPQLKTIEKCYELKPNELIIFQTKEKIKMPLNLSGSYSALDSVAKQGLLLINASIVEPGYEGYLSGVLLNFSSRSFLIKPFMEIVKINFSEVSCHVEDKLHNKEIIDHYTEYLQEKARNYSQTFLNIKEIEDEVAGRTARRAMRSFKLGGWILLFFLAFCTLEPVLYNWVWHDSWVPLTSTHIEYERAMQQRREMQVIDSLMKKVDSLQIKIEQQNARQSDTKPKAGV